MSEHQGLPARLRELRVSRKLSQDRFAEAIGVSKSLVSQFESGKAIPQVGTAQRIDELCGTGTEIKEAAQMAQEDLRPWMRPWHVNERHAALIRSWDLALIPGLLQREGYIRELFANGSPGGLGESIDDLVRNRMERQAVLLQREPPVELSCLIGEVALYQGPREVMKEQLGYLADVGHDRPVRIKIVPAGLGLHVGLGGSVLLATMADGRRIARLDDLLEGKTVTDHPSLLRLELAIEAIDGLALSVTQSRDTILERISELR